jgi:acylglycerol lipase
MWPFSSTPPAVSATPQTIFGIERLIDIPASVFPTAAEIEELEAPFHGPGSSMEHGWFESVASTIDGNVEGKTEPGRKAMIHYRKWSPSVKPQAAVHFMHGIMTHSGKALKIGDRLLHTALLADALTREGYVVYAHDLYGHGYSEGVRFFVPLTYEESNLADFEKMCSIIQEENSDIPLILIGESYGSALSVNLTMKLQKEADLKKKYNLDSFVLTCPALEADLPPLPVYWLLRYVLAPRYPTWVPFFMPNPVSADRIWEDPAVLKIHQQPRQQEMLIDGSGTPFRLGTALNCLVALESAKKSAPEMATPYCIVHGTEDHACPISGPEYFYQHTDVAKLPNEQDRQFHKIEGAYHDVLAGPKAEHCMELIVKFIQRRVEVYQSSSGK